LTMQNEEMELETVTLRDDQGRTLDCTVEHTLELDGQDYVLLLPVDSPIEIFAWKEIGEDEEEAFIVEDEAEIDRVFSIAQVVLAEQNLTLRRSAVTLTVEGDLPECEEEDLLEDDDEGEPMQPVTSFYHEEREYEIYAPLDPLFILAKLNASGEPLLLSPEELSALEPKMAMIEDQLLEKFE
jgi:hypothetical protein